MKDKHEQDDKQPTIEDLAIEEGQAAEVKGAAWGPIGFDLQKNVKCWGSRKALSIMRREASRLKSERKANNGALNELKNRRRPMNNQDNSEENKQTNSLSDLPLTGEQAEETKAGAGAHGGGGGAGKCQFQDLHFVTG